MYSIKDTVHKMVEFVKWNVHTNLNINRFNFLCKINAIVLHFFGNEIIKHKNTDFMSDFQMEYTYTK